MDATQQFVFSRNPNNVVPLIMQRKGIVDPLNGNVVAKKPINATRKNPCGDNMDGRPVVGWYRAQKMGLVVVKWRPKTGCCCGSCGFAETHYPLKEKGVHPNYL